MPGEQVGAAYVALGVDSSGLTSGLAAAKAQITGLGTNVTGLGSNFLGLNNSIGRTALAVGGITVGLVAVGVGLAKCISAAADWETKMVEVKKVTDTTDAGFKALSADLLKIRSETGASTGEIAAAAAGAGRMGIDPAEIAGYTEVILQMGQAWNTSAEFASNAVGVIGSVAKSQETTWEEFGNRVGSTINELADSLTGAVSEESLAIGMTKMTDTMARLKPSEEMISGWYSFIAVLQQAGMTAENSGEAFKDMARFMLQNKGGTIGNLIGLDPAQFQEAIRTDLIGTIEELAVAISELPFEQQQEILNEFGATGSRAMGLLVGKVDPITGDIEDLNNALKIGSDAWTEATSLEESFAESQNTLNQQVEIFKGKIGAAAIAIGNELLPFLTDAMTEINAMADALINLGSRGFGALETAGGKAAGWIEGDFIDFLMGEEDYLAKSKVKGKDIGEGVKEGIAEGTDGISENLETELKSVDAEGAGQEVGATFRSAFGTEIPYLTDDIKASLVSQKKAGAWYESGHYKTDEKGNKVWIPGAYHSYENEVYSGSYTADATLENGLNVSMDFNVQGNGIWYKLKDENGNVVAEDFAPTAQGKHDVIRGLLESAGILSYTEADVLKLSNEPIKAEMATSVDFLDLPEKIPWEAQIELKTGLNWLNKDEIEAKEKAYMDEVIGNLEAYTEGLMEEFGDSSMTAYADGFTRGEALEVIEKAEFLDKFRQENPAVWAEMGNDAIDAYIDAILAAKGDVEKVADIVGEFTDINKQKIDEATESWYNYGEVVDGVRESVESFSQWQETAANQMFYGSYIGPTSGYQAFLESEGRAAAQTIEIDADTTAADAKIKLVEDKITETKVTPIDVELEPAKSIVDKFKSYIALPVTIPLLLDTSAAEMQFGRLLASFEKELAVAYSNRRTG